MRVKKILALVLAIAMMLCAAISASAASVEFTDIEGHWAEESILRWTSTGIINGYKAADGTYAFKPNDSIKRGEFAKIMSTVLGLKEEAENTFKDLPASKWYTPYILRCAAAGIMQGDTQGYTNPEANITREQAFAMYTRTLGMDAGIKDDLKGFEDSDKVAGWAAGSVAAMYNYNAVQGHKGGDLDPKGDLTRAQAVMILDRLIGVYVDAEGNVSTSSDAAEGMVCNYVVVNAQCEEDVQVETTVNAEGKTEITVTVKEETVKVQPDNTKMPSVVVQDNIVPVDPEKDEPVKIQGATEKEDASIQTHVHSWDTLKLIKDTSCIEAGEVKCTCACGESKTEVIPVMADAHNFVEGKCTLCGKTHECTPAYGEMLEPSTCLKGGSYTETCSCGNALGVVKMPEDTIWGHKYDANHVCTLCGAKLADVTKEVFGQAQEHWYNDKSELVKEGSCTEETVIRNYCVCGAYEDETLYVMHIWSNAGICWECGMRKSDCKHEWEHGATGEYGELCMRWCPVCNTEETFEHSWKLVEKDDWGHLMSCEACKNEWWEEHTYDANGKCSFCEYVCQHQFMNSEITTPATCQEKGERTYTCHCGYTETEAVEVDTWGGHNFKLVGDLHVCTLCGEETEDHRYDTWKMTKEPTCDTLGEEMAICDCGDSYTEVVPYRHYWDDMAGVCNECGMKKSDCKHEYTYYYSNGNEGETCVKYCPVCHLEEQGEHKPVLGECYDSWHSYVCEKCERWLDDEEHVWDENSKCVECDYECEHPYFEDGICQHCSYICQHEWEDNGDAKWCTKCYMNCFHDTYDESGKCTVCQTRADLLVTMADGTQKFYINGDALFLYGSGEFESAKLLQDVTINSFVMLSGNEIDLNGFTLTVQSIQVCCNSKIYGGALNLEANGWWAIVNNDENYRLTVENATINAYLNATNADNSDGRDYMVVFSAQGGYFTLENCTICADVVDDNNVQPTVYVYKTLSSYENAVTMTDCTLEGCVEP